MQPFNLDEHFDRKVVVNGKSYAIKPTPLRDKIDGGYLQEYHKRLSADDLGEKDRLDLMCEFVRRYVPDLTQDEILEMRDDKFLALLGYIQGEEPKDILEKNAMRAAIIQEVAAQMVEKLAARETTTEAEAE